MQQIELLIRFVASAQRFVPRPSANPYWSGEIVRSRRLRRPAAASSIAFCCLAAIVLASAPGCDDSESAAPSAPGPVKQAVQTPQPTPINAAASNVGSEPPVNPLLDYRPLPPPEFAEIAAVGEDTGEVTEVCALADRGPDVTAICFSRDGQFVVSACDDRDISVWNASSGKLVKAIPTGAFNSITTLAISPDAKFVLAGEDKKPIQIWNVADGAKLAQLRETGSYPLRAAEFSPDPRMVLIHGATMPAALWDVVAGRELCRSSIAVGGNPNGRPCTFFFPDGKSLFVGGPSSNENVYSVAPGLPLTSGVSGGHADVAAACVSPDGKFFGVVRVNGAIDYTEAIFTRPKPGEPAMGKAKKVAMMGTPQKLKAMCVLPGGRYVAVYNGGKNLEYWSTRSGQSAGQFAGTTTDVTCLAISPDGKRAASAHPGGVLRLWSLPAPQRTSGEELTAFVDEVVALLNAGQYDTLEERAAALREQRSVDRFGDYRLMQFYQALAAPEAAIGDPWKAQLDRLESWLEAKPESAAARVALADFFILYAWHARGSGGAAQVSAEQFELFHQRLVNSAKHAVAAAQKAANDPAPYRSQIVAAMGLGVERKKTERAFRKGIAIDPQYYPLYSVMTNYLLPRWGGQFDANAKLADEMRQKLGGDKGLEIYARIACDVCGFGEIATLDVAGFDPQVTLQAAQVLADKYPQATGYRNFAYCAACLAKDRPAAKTLLDQLGKRVDDDKYWHDEEISRRYLRWAHFDPSKDQASLTIEAHHHAVRSLKFSPQGNILVSTSADAYGQVKLWNPATGKLLARLPHDDKVMRVAFSPDGTLMATVGGSSGGAIAKLWQLGDEVTSTDLIGHTGMVRCVAFSENGKRIVTGGVDRTARIYDLANPKSVVSLAVPDEVTAVAFLSSDTMVAVGCNDGEVLIVDLEPGRSATVYRDVKGPITGMDSRGDLLAVAGAQSAMLILDLTKKSPKLVGGASQSNPFRGAVTLSPDGQTLASGLWDPGSVAATNTVQLSNIEDSRLLHTYIGHGAEVRCVCFSPDGKRIASGADDGAIKLWDVVESEQASKSDGAP